MCGIIEWEVPLKGEGMVWHDIPGSKYIVFMFRTSSWQGELKSSAESRMDDTQGYAGRKDGAAYGGISSRDAGGKCTTGVRHKRNR